MNQHIEVQSSVFSMVWTFIIILETSLLRLH